jgi:dolichyl-phosphate-mannose--protein O-mannosyl transferase
MFGPPIKIKFLKKTWRSFIEHIFRCIAAILPFSGNISSNKFIRFLKKVNEYSKSNLLPSGFFHRLSSCNNKINLSIAQ